VTRVYTGVPDIGLPISNSSEKYDLRGGVTRTNEYRWRHPGRFFVWGFVAFLAVIGTVAALGFIFFRPAAVGYYPVGYGFFPFGFLFPLFFLFAAFWVVRWLIFPWRWGYSRHYWGGSGYGDRAYYILRERYTRGEITKDQYDQMMRDLQQHSQAV
jgi:putative membrane protein